MTPLPTQPRHLVAAVGLTPQTPQCQFTDCTAPATLRMTLTGSDGLAYLDRPICARHAGFEVDFLRDAPAGRALTLRALQ